MIFFSGCIPRSDQELSSIEIFWAAHLFNFLCVDVLFFFFFNGQVLKVIKKLHPLSWIMPVSAEPGRESRAAASSADTWGPLLVQMEGACQSLYPVGGSGEKAPHPHSQCLLLREIGPCAWDKRTRLEKQWDTESWLWLLPAVSPQEPSLLGASVLGGWVWGYSHSS